MENVKVTIRWRYSEVILVALGLLLGRELLAGDLVSRRFGATGVALPIFGADRLAPAAKVTIGSLSLGSQRRGFFRIGAFPLAVANAVEIRFLKTDPTALGDLPSAFAVMIKTDSIELHELAIYFGDASEPALRAQTAETQGEGAWKLRGVRLPDGSTVEAARLEASGAHAGKLIFEKGPASGAINIFQKSQK
ncbi:MAG: hypothetical protein JWL59_4399 [Chthoniobacteraceae bacterium]|nr:hypothetical protein [Chthoniobacteraceae bacterium]